MELKPWTYEEFPEFSEEVEGAVLLPSTGDEMGGSYTPSVEYCKVGDVSLVLQIFTPHCRNFKGDEVFPCVVHVQGSAWFEQDVYGNAHQFARLAEKGFVVAVCQYRHSGIASFPAQIIDAKNAIRFLKANADKYRIDPTKMFLQGDSSGGHTAVYAGIYHNDDTEENLFPGISADVNAIVNFYGASSFLRQDSNPVTPNHNMPDSPEGILMGGVNLNEHPELVQKLSIECQITKDTKVPPILHIHGTKDRMVNTYCTVDLYRKLKACGKETYLYLLQGADHGGPEFWTDQVLTFIANFYNTHLGTFLL